MAHELYFEDVNSGDEMPKLVKDPVSKIQLVKYAGASGDFNPLHVDDEVGISMGFEGVIAHGLLIMGFAGQAITNWIPKKHLTRFRVRFMGTTRPNEIITVTGKVTDKWTENHRNMIRCEVFARGQKDDVKVAGMFEAALPSKISK
jgi:acyl dehydratase